MPVTGYPLPFNKNDSTSATGDHAPHHNAVAKAINELSEDVDALSTSGGIQPTLVDNPGDLIIGTADNAVDRFGRGPNQTVLYSDDDTGVAPHGLRWGVVERYAPWDFPVGRYGAVGDDSTDDSVPFKNCMNAAIAYALAHNYVASIILDDKTYLLNTLDQRATPTNGGTGATGAWNTLWALPHVQPTVGRKLNIKIRGSLGTAGQPLHWLQTQPAKTGAVIRTTLQPSGPTTVNGISLFPSIIGTPMYPGGNNWSNVLVDIGGITVMSPNQGNIIGCDFRRSATLVVIGGLTITTNGTVNGQGGQGNISLANTNGGAVGIYVPENQNNDLCLIDSLCVEGYQTGMLPGEHMHIQRAALLYCQDGILYLGGGNYQHGWSIDSLSVEVCSRYGLNVGNTTGLWCPFHIGAWHSETLGGGDVNDPGSHLIGDIHWSAVSRAKPVVTGGKNINFINEHLPKGPVNGTLGTGGSQTIALPAVPGSGVPLLNPYGTACTVHVNGGTVSAIAVNGVQVTAGPGTVHVGSTHDITVTYSAPPTWVWSIE
jgi:hypothetical protein